MKLALLATLCLAVACAEAPAERQTIRMPGSLEGLGDEVPQAFVAHDAQQCGFCTPGFVVAVRAFLNKHPDATEEQIRSGLNGNICRCGTYAGVLQAAISLAKGNQNG